MAAIEYVINNKKMLCLDIMHFGNGLQTTPTVHEIICIKLKTMSSKIETVLSKLEHLSDTYKCSPALLCDNLEIIKIGPILEQTTFTLTNLKEQITTQHYNIVESKLKISDSMNILKNFNNYSTINLHEAFEKNDSSTNQGWMGTFTFVIGGAFLMLGEIKPNHMYNYFTTVVMLIGVIVTANAAYQYHNEINHRIADINYDLVQLSGALSEVGGFIDGDG